MDNLHNLHSQAWSQLVKVVRGIKGEKRFCLMTAIVERKALDIDYRKNGLRMVGLPPQGLIKEGDKISARLNVAHCQICIPAMRTGKWEVREPILEVPTGKRRIRAPEWSIGSPGPWLNQILNQGLTVWYTAMVYNHGIQGG